MIDIAWAKHKYFLSRKYVDQTNGADLDVEQVELGKEKAKAAELAKARAEGRAARAAAMMEQVALGVNGAAGTAYASPVRNGKGGDVPAHRAADDAERDRRKDRKPKDKEQGARLAETERAPLGKKDKKDDEQKSARNDKDKDKGKGKEEGGAG